MPELDQRRSAAATLIAPERSGEHAVQIRQLQTLAELAEAERLYASIWVPNSRNPPISAELMRALTKAGNYLGGAFAEGELVGACLGFFEEPDSRSIHSHIAGVVPGMRGRNVGFALKRHQRDWALRRGIGTISWTFDPLVCRNAYFNVCKLGAEPAEYLPNFYGDMDDLINGSGDTDRLLVRWRLDAPQVAAACAGQPTRACAASLLADGAAIALDRSGDGRPTVTGAEGDVLLVAVPEDVEALRLRDAPLAAAWQRALGDVLGGLLADGMRVLGFDRAGWYALARDGAAPSG